MSVNLQRSKRYRRHYAWSVPWLFGLCSVLVAADDELIRDKLAALSSRTARSASGHFLVNCPDVRLHMPVLNWADRIVGALPQELAGLVDFNGRTISLVVEPDSASPSLSHFEDGMGFRQVLVLPADMLGTPEGERWVCRALLGAWRLPERGWIAMDSPRWLVLGVAGQLGAQARAASMDAALDAWQRGQLPAPTALLDPAQDPQPLDAVAAVALLRCYADHRDAGGQSDMRGHMATLLTILAERGGGAAGDHLVATISGGAPGSLVDAWDRWLEGERDVVHAVGMVSPRLLARIEAELLLSEGVYGIPRGAFKEATGSFSDLPMVRDEPWFEAFAQEKKARIQMLVSGRGASLVRMANGYCDYLTALEQKAPAEEAARLLAEAERRRAALRHELSAVPGPRFEVGAEIVEDDPAVSRDE